MKPERVAAPPVQAATGLLAVASGILLVPSRLAQPLELADEAAAGAFPLPEAAAPDCHAAQLLEALPDVAEAGLAEFHSTQVEVSVAYSVDLAASEFQALQLLAEEAFADEDAAPFQLPQVPVASG